MISSCLWDGNSKDRGRKTVLHIRVREYLTCIRLKKEDLAITFCFKAGGGGGGVGEGGEGLGVRPAERGRESG